MFVAGIAVMSLDGCLTRHEEPGTGFASAADHAFFRKALQDFDCTLMGRRTFEAGRASILRAREGSRLQMVLTTTPERFAADAIADHLEFHRAGALSALRDLAGRGRSRCALLGGSRLYTEAALEGLLDELWITIEPVAFGHGAPMFERGAEFQFRFLGSENLSGDTILLRYGGRGCSPARFTPPRAPW